MTLSIANNVTSINAQNNLTRANRSLRTSVERLSSGLRVNRGADGPAALVISERQRAQIAGLRAAIDNSEKATSLVQTAEGALSEINSLLVRVRSLAIDSANTGFNDDDALAANQSEITNALDTIDRIANNTQFGTRRLLNGDAGVTGVASSGGVTVLRGTSETNSGNFTVNVSQAAERGSADAALAQTGNLAAAETLTINGTQVTLDAGLSQAQVISRINEFSGQTGVLADAGGAGGATRLFTEAFGDDQTVTAVSNLAAAGTTSGIGTTTITGTGDNIEITIDGGAAIEGNGATVTVDTGDAEGLSLSFAIGSDPVESVSGAQGTVTVNNDSLVFQIGPNRDQTASVTVDRVNPQTLGLGVEGNQFANLNEIDVTSASRAQDALSIVDAAIAEITNLRGDLGAFQQNTLTSTANNLRTTLENSINAESVIRDTDFAAEIAEFTSNQILVQAGTSVLGNANQIPQGILSLLQ